MTYARARLLLGMSAVGTAVTASTILLVIGAPAGLQTWTGDTLPGHVGALALFLIGYGLLQLPFDVLGGYVLPRRFGRVAPEPGVFAFTLLRAVVVHGLFLMAFGLLIIGAARLAGVTGVVGAALGGMLMLLGGQIVVARMVGRLRVEREASEVDDASDLPVRWCDSTDEGFSGAIVGLFRPRALMLPVRWLQDLPGDALRLAILRRGRIVAQGGWRRGRLLALGWNVLGVALVALLIGSDALSRAEGVISLSLGFTLWSFVGLLLLPTPSRWGVLEADRDVLQDADPALLADMVRRLDDLQDGERQRGPVVESIFHPVPSVRARLGASTSQLHLGWWNAARTAVFLSWAGLGLLGRAVHCNCGRPDLWAMLPTD